MITDNLIRELIMEAPKTSIKQEWDQLALPMPILILASSERANIYKKKEVVKCTPNFTID